MNQKNFRRFVPASKYLKSFQEKVIKGNGRKNYIQQPKQFTTQFLLEKK